MRFFFNILKFFLFFDFDDVGRFDKKKKIFFKILDIFFGVIGVFI